MTLILKKNWPFLVIIGLTLIAFAPIFNLALTGDDYLSLWRYQYYLEFRPNHQDWNLVKFLFTDYGPQDSLFTLIHHFVGFQHQVYYGINLILRLFAAWSIYLLTNKLTNDQRSGLLSMAFFAITTTGLETTNWAFNMPSYIAIFFLCLFIYFRLKLINHFSFIQLLLVYLLFSLSILSQPIRMTFLPIFAIWLEILIFLLSTPRKISRLSLAPGYLAIFSAIVIFGFIGNSVNAGETFQARIIDQGWTKLVGNNLSNISNKLSAGQSEILLYPIGQLGNIVIPDGFIQLSADPRLSQGAKLSTGLLSIMIILISTCAWWWRRLPQPFTIGLSLLTLGWTLLVWYGLVILPSNSLSTNQLSSFLIGGYFIILIGLLFWPYLKNKSVLLCLLISVSLIFLGFATYWLRSPNLLLETTVRYLIIPAAGLSLLIGLISSLIKDARRQIIMIGVIAIIFSVHLISSHRYLFDLMQYRSITKAETNRNTIPYSPTFLNPDEPMIYYFEPQNSREIYHTLMFGFPLFIGYRFDIQQIWHIAYTDSWPELQAAYLDGSSLKRFSIPIKPVKLENIYSFKLDNGKLVDTTSQTRTKLKNLHENH